MFKVDVGFNVQTREIIFHAVYKHKSKYRKIMFLIQTKIQIFIHSKIISLQRIRIIVENKN